MIKSIFFNPLRNNSSDKKIRKYGFSDVSLNLFASYLQNRKQCVKINEYGSSDQYVTNGIPQGTMLCLMVFLINIGSIFKLNLFGLSAFADDMAI